MRIGSAGQPIAATDAKRALLEIVYFSGLGALIVFLSGSGLGADCRSATARDLEYELAKSRWRPADTFVCCSSSRPRHRVRSRRARPSGAARAPGGRRAACSAAADAAAQPAD